MRDEDGRERPFKCPLDDGDNGNIVTVGMLKKMLKSAPDDYVVTFDSRCCTLYKDQFTIYHKHKVVSING